MGDDNSDSIDVNPKGEQNADGVEDNHAQSESASDTTRRRLMQAGGALGVGALLGGGARHAVDPVTAAASTSDADGDVGTPSNRVDVFADGIDISSDIVSGNNTVYDVSNSYVPAARVEGGDGSGLDADLIDGRELYVQSSSPSSPNSGDIWIDTS